jgi:hypothetical protein
MAIEITHVRMFIGGTTHERIMGCRWCGIEAEETGTTDVPSLVDWIAGKGGAAYVGRGPGAVAVGIVRPEEGEPYVRAYAHGVWTDDLMTLPRF